MFNIGDKVNFTIYTNDGDEIIVPAVVTKTWYEPNDPVQGLALVDDKYKEIWSLHASDCTHRKS